MHFPLQLALSAVLANGIVAELTNSQQNKPVQKELDSKFQSQPGFEQQESAPTSYIQQVSKYYQVILSKLVKHIVYFEKCVIF